MKIIITIIFILAGLFNLYAGQRQLVPYGELAGIGNAKKIIPN